MFVNDSKATNIDALEKSIASFDTPIILIAGGRGKKGGYRSLRGAVEEKVEALFLKMGWEREGLDAYMGRLPGTLPLHEKKLIGLIQVFNSNSKMFYFLHASINDSIQ